MSEIKEVWEWKNCTIYDNAVRLMIKETNTIILEVDMDGELRINDHNSMRPISESKSCPNANLIAAAPELLTACEAFVESHLHPMDTKRVVNKNEAFRLASAAIVKARGQQ